MFPSDFWTGCRTGARRSSTTRCLCQKSDGNRTRYFGSACGGGTSGLTCARRSGGCKTRRWWGRVTWSNGWSSGSGWRRGFGADFCSSGYTFGTFGSRSRTITTRCRSCCAGTSGGGYTATATARRAYNGRFRAYTKTTFYWSGNRERTTRFGRRARRSRRFWTKPARTYWSSTTATATVRPNAAPNGGSRTRAQATNTTRYATPTRLLKVRRSLVVSVGLLPTPNPSF